MGFELYVLDRVHKTYMFTTDASVYYHCFNIILENIIPGLI